MTERSQRDPSALATALKTGARRELAQAITLVESDHPLDRELAASLIESLLRENPSSVRLGISGPPGVGKSTLIETVGGELLRRGKRVAVLAVDPSSELSGGSLLADKTRMPGLSRSPNAYVRPSPARAHLGGVAARTQEAALLCEAAGFDTVIIETVGVGQSEHAAKYLVDCLMVLALPGSGDEIQGMKRGLMEHADILVVNKADGDMIAAAEQTRSDLERALRLSDRAGVPPEVLAISATVGTGVARLLEVVEFLLERYTEAGELRRRATLRHREWTRALVEEAVLEHYFADDARRRELETVLSDVEARRLSPYGGVRAILRAWLGGDRSSKAVGA